MFALLGALLLASLAVSDESPCSADPPLGRSASISPREIDGVKTNYWAGLQHAPWLVRVCDEELPSYEIFILSAKFIFPTTLKPWRADPTNVMIIAAGVGKLGETWLSDKNKQVLLAGLEITLTRSGIATFQPVWGFNLSSLQIIPYDLSDTIRGGDGLEIKIITPPTQPQPDARETIIVVTNLNIHRPWTAEVKIPAKDLPVGYKINEPSVSGVMVMSIPRPEDPNSKNFVYLPDFEDVNFLDFTVIYLPFTPAPLPYIEDVYYLKRGGSKGRLVANAKKNGDIIRVWTPRVSGSGEGTTGETTGGTNLGSGSGQGTTGGTTIGSGAGHGDLV